MCIVDPKVLKPSSSHHHHIIHEKHRIIEATFSLPSLQSCSCAQVLPDVIIENEKKQKNQNLTSTPTKLTGKVANFFFTFPSYKYGSVWATFASVFPVW